jgi:hypothetical protein
VAAVDARAVVWAGMMSASDGSDRAFAPRPPAGVRDAGVKVVGSAFVASAEAP